MNINDLLEVVYDFYPKHIDLNDPILVDHTSYKKLTQACHDANNNQSDWKAFLKNIKGKIDIEITEFVLLPQLNPSFIAVFLINDYTRPKHVDYEPLQLVLKISAIAPVYTIYFDNLVSDWNKRLIRSNSMTPQENNIFNIVQEAIIEYYPDFSLLNTSLMFQALPELGNVSMVNKRKPYINECVFGLYLSIHPHNILEDKFENNIIFGA